jgi:hypothetical protein
MKTLREILSIVLLILVIVGLVLIVSRYLKEEPTSITETVDTVYVTKTDTIWEVILFPEIQWKEKIVLKPVPQDVDTNKILEEYFLAGYIEREIERKNLYLMIRDTISQNRITWSEIEYQLYIDTVFRDIIITREIERFKSGFYGNLGISNRYISPGVSYMNKKGFQIGLGLHIGKEWTPYLQLAVPLN